MARRNRAMRRLSMSHDPERGSVSSWFISGTVVMILGVGIAVDLTGQVHAQQRATSVAFEAARSGAQQLDSDAAIIGTGDPIDPRQAAIAVDTYLATAGIDGFARVRGDVVAVETSTVYRPKFLSFIGLTEMPVSGHGEARAVHAVDGVEQ